jgi:hypothetical protein
MPINSMNIKKKNSVVAGSLVACALVAALAGTVGCGSTEKHRDGGGVGGADGGGVPGGTDTGSIGGGADGGVVAGGADTGSIGGGADRGSIGGSDVYLTCKVNGESVRIEGTGTVVANYQVKEDATVVQTGGPQKYRFLFDIPGKTTGSFKLGDGYLALVVMDMNNGTIWESSRDQDDNGAVLQVGVTSYGAVGGYVDGTFSGTAVNIADGSKLVITEGEFRASRITDI